MFDSCYLRPDENPLVIQQTNPVIIQTQAEAKKRFDMSLDASKQQIEQIEVK